MTYEEAIAWLNGLRSMINTIPCDPMETWAIRIAQADTAMSQQAYWIATAHKEQLVPIIETADK